jgi:D-sedoheptulose 7-phosphate isomerase
MTPVRLAVTERDWVRAAFSDAARLHERTLADRTDVILEAGRWLVEALGAGRRVLVFGNGGSATDAEHLASELVGRFSKAVTRRGWPVIALTSDSAIVTSVANDFGFDEVFARQIDALGAPGDVAIGITTSGASANVNRAIERARASGLRTIALTGGDGGESGRLADLDVNVPSSDGPRVQEVHRTIVHVWCELVERELAGMKT